MAASPSPSSYLNPQAPEFLPAGTQTTPFTLPFPYNLHNRTGFLDRPFMCYYNAFAMFPHNSYNFSGGKLNYKTLEPTSAGKDRKFVRSFGFRTHNRSYLPPRLRRQKIWASKKTAIPVTDPHRDHVHNCDFDKPEDNFAGKTSVMIKNIPNKFRRNDLLRLLDNHCRKKNIEAGLASGKNLSSYDFLYLPMDFVKHANLGYAFVNFTSSVAAEKFRRDYDKFVWTVPGNKKTCEITLAKYQGKEELSRHFKNSRFTCHTDAYLPVFLSPPSDGLAPYNLTLLGQRTGAHGGASSPLPSDTNHNKKHHHRA